MANICMFCDKVSSTFVSFCFENENQFSVYTCHDVVKLIISHHKEWKFFKEIIKFVSNRKVFEENWVKKWSNDCVWLVWILRQPKKRRRNFMGETIKVKCNKFSVIQETWKFGWKYFLGVLSKLEKLKQFSVSF